MLADLDQRTADWFGEDNAEATHLDYVAAWQAEGKTLSQLALELRISWEMIKDHLNRKHGREETNARLTRAREEGAHRLAEQSLDIADKARPEDVQVARLQVSTRQWVAEKWNARELGQKQGATVQINVGALMLAALQAPPPTAIPAAIADEAEVLSLDSATSYEVE